MVRDPAINRAVRDDVLEVGGLREEEQLTEYEVEFYNRTLLAMSLHADDLAKLHRLAQERLESRGG